MMKLTAFAAFRALSEILAGKRAPDSVSFKNINDIGLERLRKAIKEDSAFTLDKAVLLRQVLLGEQWRRGDSAISLPAHQNLDNFAETVGMEIVDGQVRALPWCPPWLPDAMEDLACRAAALEARRFGSSDKGPVVDPFLFQFGYAHYRSGAQRAAIRSALLAPPGSTTAIVLPTGEGKSTVFHSISEIGFASDRDVQRKGGVTVVIVPTVALAYDHERNFRKSAKEHLAYVSGTPSEIRTHIRDRIEDGSQRLVFVAPEAACQSLRPALLSTARSGHLKALVIDEAHLIDAWGTGFRTEFQSLSGLRRDLISASPPERSLRTLLLSATIAPETLETLKDLFVNPGEFRTLFAGQLRPEPDFWVAAPTSTRIRDDHVVEALYKLPRPLILYVTEVEHAKKWYCRLYGLGYTRLSVFHGKTPDSDRRKILSSWQSGDLDIVIATSAFGLGIDYPHVRSIVHACVPESLDRFYQEVGRAGRDGCASISIIIPACHDFETARSLNNESILTIERGLERWNAMFKHPDSVHCQGTTFRIRIDVAPGSSPGDIDIVGDKNLRWNAHLLSLLSRAGLIRLGGSHEDSASLTANGQENCETTGYYKTVEILESNHLNKEFWQGYVEPVRQKIRESRKRNLALMYAHLRGKNCPSDLLLDLYGGDNLDPMCTECTLCRASVKSKKAKVLPKEPAPCWEVPPLHGTIKRWMKNSGNIVIKYNPIDNSPVLPRRWAKAFDEFWGSGLRCLAIVGNLPNFFDRAIEDLKNKPIFVSSTFTQLPIGPRVAMVGSGCTVALFNTIGCGSTNRLLIIPEDMQDIDRPGEVALARYSGLVFDLNEFLRQF